MAVTIIATALAADANSFVTEAEMTAYCEARLNSGAWDADNEEHPVALVEATRELTLMEWLGARSTPTQALAWPRIEVPNPDLRDVTEGLFRSPILRYSLTAFPSDRVPDRIKYATCELALAFLRAGNTDLAVADTSAAVKRTKTGPLETEYFGATEGAQRPTGIDALTRFWAYITPLLRNGGSGFMLLRS